MERRIDNYVKSLEKKGSLTIDQYREIKAIGITPGISYGLFKVHEALTYVWLLFRPMLLQLELSYKLAMFSVPKLSSITFNKFTLKESFAFAKEILHQNKSFSLFTNIPLKETNICTDLLYKKEDVIQDKQI